MNRRPAHILFPVLLLFCFCFPASAQQLNIRNFSIEDGLPQSQILSIVQDHGGVIWLSTNGGGVSRFDGLKFSNLSTKNGLPSNRVNVVFEDKSHLIWIGTAKGVIQYRDRALVPVTDSLISSRIINSIHQLSNGEIWFGTNFGIVIYNGKTYRPFERNADIGNFQVWVVKQDNIGNVWIGTVFNGVFKYDGTKMTHFDHNSGLIDSRNKDILINGDKVWIATLHGINVYDQSKAYAGTQKLDTLKINGKPYLDGVYKFYKDANDAIWVGNTVGVDKISNNKIRRFTPANGLCNARIYGIIQDQENNMWFGSFTGGVSQYRNDLFINVNEKHGLSHNTVMSFLKDSKDNMWVGTWGGGVSKIDFNKFRSTGEVVVLQNYGSKKDEAGVNNTWAMCEDKQGNVWFGTSGGGITRYDGKEFKLFHLKSGLHGIRITSLVCDKKGNIWIAHENGLDKFDGKTFTYYATAQGFSAHGVGAIFEDNLGTLWFGCNDRLVKYDGKVFTTILRPEGFPKIKNITRDIYGYTWISTDAGVCVYNGKTFRMITENDGLSSNTVYYVRKDGEGNLWLGTNNGIDRLDLNQFVNKKEIVLKHYGKEEGFMGLECNQNAFYKDIDGKLWIGTIGGVTIYDPRQEKKNVVEPKTRINDIRLFLEKFDYKKYADSLENGLPKDLKLPYDKNHLTFDFIGISHTVPSKVRYQYMLEGFDADWLPQGQATSTTYSNLPPGKYSFLLKASNDDGLWNASPVSFSFEIVPPFWKRLWFYLFVTAAGLSGIFLMIKMRERSLVHSQRLLERQVSIRTNELLAEKEKLQLAYSDIDGKNKDITDSIHYAKRIQKAILPADSTIKSMLNEHFVLYQPKAIVSGDFYWLEKWGNETLIAAVDCTGHGVPGAFMSIVCHNILTQTVNVLGLTRPSLILNETNSQLTKKLNQDPEVATVRDGMDVSLIAINYPKMKLEFAGANNPLWLIRDNELIQINGDKFPIGAFVGEELHLFRNHEYELQKGDCLYMFTDGFADQFGGPKGKKFKYKQFEELLLKYHKETMEVQKKILSKTINDWIGDLDQIDDILVIGVRI